MDVKKGTESGESGPLKGPDTDGYNEAVDAMSV
jgi:hypothetical protein